MGSRPTVVLAEDQALVQQGLLTVLRPDFDVLDVVPDGDAVPDRCDRLRPDLLILAVSLDNRNGLDLMPDVRRRAPDTRILVLTRYPDWTMARSAFAAGALGFLPKDCSLAELQKAIEAVLAGRRFLSSRVRHPNQVARGPVGHDFWRLTPRQREILQAIGEGKSTEEVSRELNVSRHTVHFHRRRLRRALGIAKQDGLTRFAVMMNVQDET